MGKHNFRFIINLGLLICGLLTAFTGILIQIGYHMGNHGNIDINHYVYGISYSGWSAIHKTSIVALTLLMIHHFVQHWKWYKGVITKRLLRKNRQVLILSLIFIVVALTGLTPWIMSLLPFDGLPRKWFIEIHDKLAILLTIYLVLHITKRLKWYSVTLKSLRNKT